jgi:hypothetical protein
MPSRVSLTTRDLFFRSKLTAVIAAAGGAITNDDAACDLAVVDLDESGVLGRIRALAGRGVPVLAYGSHVRADLLRAAREAGAVAVPNSAVEEKLRELLQTT